LRLQKSPEFAAFLILASAALAGIEILFLGSPGLQADEVLFVLPYVPGAHTLYSWSAGHIQIPVMLMDYVGAVKSWLYWPIFKLWHPGIWSIRLPGCAFSIATLILFAVLVRRTAGWRVATAAAALLATDASFIFTNVFDWGPVALLLLGALACLNLFQLFFATGRIWYAAVGSFVAGVALWYKAIFLFPLVGTCFAAFLVWRRELKPRLSAKIVLAALASFFLGALPLLLFNLERPGATFAASRSIDQGLLAEKIVMLERTLDGRAFEHYLFRSFPGEKIALAGASLPDLVMSWYRTSRLAPGSGMLFALCASLPALIFLRRTSVYRTLLFVWFAFLFSLGLMLIFRDAGAGPHHMVLLFPAPHFIVAATIVAIGDAHIRAGRIANVCLVLILISNAVLIGRYFEAARHNGFAIYWTNGLSDLARVLKAQEMPIAFLDWGMRDPAEIASGNSLRVIPASSEPRPGVLYVRHCTGYVIQGGESERFDRRVNAAQLVPRAYATVADSLGNPVFCLFRLDEGRGNAR
jgi:4-amino-4-deoxy-L-arabinose transferase-like glycosyltransferase